MCGSPKEALRAYWDARKDWKALDKQCKESCEFCHGSLILWECYYKLQEEIEARGKHEQELLGTLLSIDPLGDYMSLIVDEENFPGENNMFPGERAKLGGLIVKIKNLVTKTGKNPGAEMCQLWIELPTRVDDVDEELLDEEEETQHKDDSIQLVAFPDIFARYKSQIEVGSPVLVEIEKLKSGLQLKQLFRLDILKETKVG
jgi:hypothetical protein